MTFNHTFARMFVLPLPNTAIIKPDYSYQKSFSLCLRVFVLGFSPFKPLGVVYLRPVCFQLEMAQWHK